MPQAASSNPRLRVARWTAEKISPSDYSAVIRLKTSSCQGVRAWGLSLDQAGVTAISARTHKTAKGPGAIRGSARPDRKRP